MTSVLRRVVAPFAAVTALVATLSACGTGPNQVNSAVIIGDRVISVDQVQSLVNKVTQEPAALPIAQQHKLDLVAREVVTQLVTHELLTKVARKENLRVDSKQVAQYLQQNPIDQKLPTDGSVPTETLVPILVARARGVDAFAGDELMLLDLAQKYYGRATARFNVASFTTDKFADAKALAEKIVASPDEGADIMRKGSGKDMPPQLDRDTGPSVLGLELMLPANSVLIINQPGDSQNPGAIVVVQVLSTKIAATASADPNSDQVDANQLSQFGKFVLRKTALDTDLRISPRYGEWNMSEMSVVPTSEAEVSGMLFLPKTNKS